LTVLHEAPEQAKAGISRLRRSLAWQKHARYVASILQQFDGCTVVSEQELALVKEIAPFLAATVVVPNGVDVSQMSGDFGEPQPNSMIYSGALSYSANLDAMHYFVQEIFPTILAANPQAYLKITGSIASVPVSELPIHPALTLTGYLPDVRPAIAGSALSVTPLRIGGGTRLKILESLALGTPVVTTSKGIEGLRIAAGEGILIADTPELFAEAALSILQNPALRLQLSVAGRYAVQAYDWQKIGQLLLTFIDEIMRPLRQPHHRRRSQGQA
jgi:glycosyltransferase involved in cell wall biosynthesis